MSIKYPNQLYRSNILKIIVLDEPQVEDEKNVSTIKKELLILMPQVFKPGYSEMRSLRNRETEQIWKIKVRKFPHLSFFYILSICLFNLSYYCLSSLSCLVVQFVLPDNFISLICLCLSRSCLSYPSCQFCPFFLTCLSCVSCLICSFVHLFPIHLVHLK